MDPFARLLYIAMWNFADDYGVGVANPRELLGFAFPLDEDITVAQLRGWLADIGRVYGVVFFEVERRAYYAIPSWDRHQKIDHRSARKKPEPPEESPVKGDIRESSRDSREDSAESRENFGSPRRDLGVGNRNRGTGEQGKKEEEHGDASAADQLIPPPAPKPDQFEEFWVTWPRKDSKAEAKKAWAKAIRATDPNVIIAAARAYSESPYRPERQYVPHAATWLNQRRWEDPLPQPPEERRPVVPAADTSGRDAWLAARGVSLERWHELAGEHGEREARRIIEGRVAA